MGGDLPFQGEDDMNKSQCIQMAAEHSNKEVDGFIKNIYIHCNTMKETS
jgi:hypothetical protein